MKEWIAPKGYVEKRYNYTYKLTFKLDERYYYYGVHSTNIDPEYDNYYGSGSNIKLYHKKYGKDCFHKEILEFFSTKKESLIAERKLVPKSLLDDIYCLNKVEGGGTFDASGYKLTDEQKKKMSERLKGKKRTHESIIKMIETRRKRGTDKQTEESKKKISDSKKNRVAITNNSDMKFVKKDDLEKYINDGWILGYPKERNEKIAKSKLGDKNPNYGKTISQEIIDKMLMTKKKNGTLQHSAETKNKLANLNRKKAKDVNFRKRLSNACKGVNTWSKGRVFVNKNGVETTCFKEDVDKYICDGWNKGRLTKNERKYYKDIKNDFN